MNKLAALMNLSENSHSPVEVSYQNTVADAIRFNLFHIPRLPFIQILIALLVGGQIVLTLPRMMSPLASIEDRLLAAGLLVMGIGALVALLIAGITFLTALPKRRDTEEPDHRTVRISSTGVEESCREFRRHYSWADIDSVKENRTQVYLYTGPHTAIVVPKRAFVSDRECSVFIAYAREQWAHRRRFSVASS